MVPDVVVCCLHHGGPLSEEEHSFVCSLRVAFPERTIGNDETTGVTDGEFKHVVQDTGGTPQGTEPVIGHVKMLVCEAGCFRAWHLVRVVEVAICTSIGGCGGRNYGLLAC